MALENDRFIDRLLEKLGREGQRSEKCPAVYYQGELVFTYGELLREATRQAGELVKAGVKPGEIVALGMEKSPAYLAGLLGVWCARAAFMPLRPSLPAKKRQWIMADARPRAVLKSRSSLRAPVMEIYAGEKRRKEGLAYVIYTSGSSGSPRGVALGHGGILPFVEAQIEAFQLHSESRVLWYLSADFDASHSDILTALFAGASIYIEDSEEMKDPGALMGLLRERRITHVDLPPSLLAALDPERVGPSLETLIIGGEVCPLPEVHRWSKKVRLVNCYGPTEATVCTSMAICSPHWDLPLIGTPLPGVRYEVRREDDTLAAPGEVGELFISGPAVALGYLNCPEETAARFVDRGGERTFRTGDLLRVHDDGELEFLGRKDRLIKVGGKWVNPEALEVLLGAAPGIARAAVVPRIINGSLALVAFYMANGDDLFWPPELPSMRRKEVKALPLTASGKVDLPALEKWPLSQQPDSVGSTKSGDFASPLEAAIASLYGAVLDQKPARRDDDFFCLGGDSLRSLHLVALAARHGIALTPEMVASDGRVWALAKAVAKAVEDSESGKERVAANALAKDAEALALLLPSEGQPDATPGPWNRIFLTGATGTLGRLVLQELLARTEAEIYCLVRASSEEEAHRRLGHTSSRIKIIKGDLSRPLLGLPEQTWKSLTHVDAIFHLAASVKLAASYKELKGPNLDGTFEVLRLLRTGPAKELHYVSTLSVAVATDKPAGVVPRESLKAEGHVWGGYAQSKWAAEWLVRSAAPEARIYRPGLLVGTNTSGTAAEMLHYFWRGTTRLGCVPKEFLDVLEVDITPADWAAKTMVEQALEVAPGAIAHIASPRPFTLRLLVDSLRAAGEHVEAISSEDWRRRLFQYLDLELSGYLLAMCRCLGDEAYAHWRAFDLFQATGYRFFES